MKSMHTKVGGQVVVSLFVLPMLILSDEAFSQEHPHWEFMIPISLGHMDDMYTGEFHIGDPSQPVNLIIDTGSSMTAVFYKNDGLGGYDPSKNTRVQNTNWFQKAVYDDDSTWRGRLVNTPLGIQYNGPQGRSTIQAWMANVTITCNQISASDWGTSDGILGLAFKELNYVQLFDFDPGCHDFAKKYDNTTPTFITQLLTETSLPNLFSLYTQRSKVFINPPTEYLNPNIGVLVFGMGEEHVAFYHGEFSDVAILQDQYYGVMVESLSLNGNAIPIQKPIDSSPVNAIIDSGDPRINLDINKNKLIQLFRDFNGSMGDLVEKGLSSNTVSKFDLDGWPDLELSLKGSNGGTVALTLSPDTYWQTDVTSDGKMSFRIDNDSDEYQPKSTIGLPLLNNYYTVFDRTQNRLRFAKRRALKGLIGVGGDRRLYTSNTLNGQWLPVPNSGYVIDVALMQDGTLLGISNDLAGELFTKKTLGSDWIKVPGSGSVKSISIMQDGTILGVGMDYTLWTMTELGQPWVKQPSNHLIKAVAAMPDGKILGVSYDNFGVYHKLLVKDNLEADWQLIENSGSSNDVSVLPDGRILGVNLDGSLKIRDSLEADWKSLDNKGIQVLAADWWEFTF